jgi:hypothetical protein
MNVMFQLQSKTFRRKFLLLTVLFVCFASAVYTPPRGRTAKASNLEGSLPSCTCGFEGFGSTSPLPCWNYDRLCCGGAQICY